MAYEWPDGDFRSGVLNWKRGTQTVAGLDLQPCNDCRPDVLDKPVAAKAIGAVLDPEEMEGYLDRNKRGEVDVPQYYSRIDTENEHYITKRPTDDDNAEFDCIRLQYVEAALRVLNGEGRYPANEHVLHDCLPYPSVLEREGVGAVVITPAVGKE